MHDYERLGAFYLGKRFDPAAQSVTDDLILYDSKDLTTHAACIGMTGSGKTGLALALLEEALIDGVPCLIIDPKGDLGNLLLSFPELRAEDFAPWVDPEEARRQAVSVDELAGKQAELWRKGLADWGQDGDRIRRLHAAADITLYTPGSLSGRPVAAIRSFAAPGKAVLDDPDAFRERLGSTATGLLALLGIDADPLRSREHILVTRILEHAWSAGRDLDVASLVREVQEPPLTRVGAFDLETFFPAKERFELALQLNNLLAAPGMQAWMEGEPLDIDAFLHGPNGKPRASIFSIAHLGDAERMFFVTLLLTEIVAWMRTQPGSSSLRAVLYMDEVFGYFPPVANPPSKQPLLTLLKQARAFGLGVVLATQNPVDLDYKGLANMGTWFLGRLQTQQDRARVLDGLQSANAAGGRGFDRDQLERLLASMGKRVFLMNNAHDDAPELFQVRWALSYLRGPLSRDEISRLARPGGAPLAANAAATVTAVAPRPAPATSQRPLLPPDLAQSFLRATRPASADETLVYEPAVLGEAVVAFRNAKTDIDQRREVVLVARLDGAPASDLWEGAERLVASVPGIDPEPGAGARFGDVPPEVLSSRSWPAWSRQLASHLRDAETLEVFTHRATRLTSAPGEPERDFRIRVQEGLRAARDEATADLRRRYAPKLAALEEKLRNAQHRLERESEQVQHQGLQTAISIGATLLGAFLGRKVGATTAARSAGRVLKEQGDVARAGESVEAVSARLAELNAEFARELETLGALPGEADLEFEVLVVRPARGGVEVRRVAFVWLPGWASAGGGLRAAWG
jgi:hypothetical protein